MNLTIALLREIISELLECFATFDSVFERRFHRELTEGERVHSGVFTGVSSEI